MSRKTWKFIQNIEKMRHFLCDAFFKERRKLTAEGKSAPTICNPHIGQRQYLTNWITYIPHHQQAVGKDDISVISSTPCCKLYLWQPSWLRGAGGRLWTPDLMLTKHLLYQLSYTSIWRMVSDLNWWCLLSIQVFKTCAINQTLPTIHFYWFTKLANWFANSRYMSVLLTFFTNFTLYKLTQHIPCIFLPL